MASCVIGVGANLGDRTEVINFARGQLDEHADITVTKTSSLHWTCPVGGPADQGDFLNAAFLLSTTLPPAGLLTVLRNVEQAAGRTRTDRWGARHLDLDLLLHGDSVIEMPGVVVPHPRLAFRRFVLQPAAEIAAEMLHPTTGRTIRELLHRLDSLAKYVAVGGATGDDRRTLVHDSARRANATAIFAGTQSHANGGDSSSRQLPPPIEFLDLQVRLLRDVDAAQENQAWISDFWLGETRVFARDSLQPGKFAEFEDAWQQLAAEMPEPMVVALFGEASELINEAHQERLPVLKLDISDADWARQELAAAIEAM